MWPILSVSIQPTSCANRMMLRRSAALPRRMPILTRTVKTANAKATIQERQIADQVCRFLSNKLTALHRRNLLFVDRHLEMILRAC